MTSDASITNNLLYTIYQADVPKNRCALRQFYSLLRCWHFPLPLLPIWKIALGKYRIQLLNECLKNAMEKAGEVSGGGKRQGSIESMSVFILMPLKTTDSNWIAFPFSVDCVRCAIDKSSIMLCVHVRVHDARRLCIRTALRVCGFR